MGNLSKYRGSSPIGDQKLMARRAPRIFDGAGHEWLLTGFLLPSSGYAAAAALDHLRAHNLTASASAAPGGVMTSIATDGASTFVLAYGNATNVYVSTDGGVTWTQRAHNAGGNVRKVIWTGTRFVCVANSTTNLFAATSSDGVTWTASAVAGSLSLTADTVVTAWNGSVVIVVAQGSTNAYTSPSGLAGTWTARALGGTVGSAPQIDAGAFQSVILNGTSNTTGHFKSADGTTWSTLTLPTGQLANTRPLVLSDRVVLAFATTTTQYSTDMSTWSSAVTHGFTLTATAWQHFWRAGSKICFSLAGRVVYTTDGSEYFCHSLSDTSGNLMGAQSATRQVYGDIGADTPPRYAVSTMDASNAIGISQNTNADSTAGIAIATVYVRVK